MDSIASKLSEPAKRLIEAALGATMANLDDMDAMTTTMDATNYDDSDWSDEDSNDYHSTRWWDSKAMMATRSNVARSRSRLGYDDLDVVANVVATTTTTMANLARYLMNERATNDRCNQCGKTTTSPFWCQPCNSSRFQSEFDNWKSENDIINWFIRKVQLEATSSEKILEWIPYSKFEDVKTIGKGGFGKVYSAKWTEGYILYWNAKDSQWKRRGIMNVALKDLNDSQNITKEFLNEIKNLHDLNDENSHITRCYGITQREGTNNFMIVMQLIEGGDLRKSLSEFRNMSWKEKFISLSRIADGLYQMHQANLLHRDFHTGNILFSNIRNNILYITDLGLCKPASEAENQKVYGVLPYVAPEVLRGEKYTEAADVYAFGVIMCEVISGILPFNNIPHNQDLLIRIYSGERPNIPRNTPALISELIKKCWDADPQKRLSSYELRIILRAWRYMKKGFELFNQIENFKQIEKSEDSDKIHPEAFYKSRCLTDELIL